MKYSLSFTIKRRKIHRTKIELIVKISLSGLDTTCRNFLLESYILERTKMAA